MFGDEVTMDHWFTNADISKGLQGEHVGLVLRDRATDWVECRGMTDKSAENVTTFLTQIQGRDDKIKYCY